MKLLFYEDPLTDKNDITWRLGHIHLDAVAYRAWKNLGVECRMLVNEHGYETAVEVGIDPNDLILIAESKVSQCLFQPHDRLHHLFHERYCYDWHPHPPKILRFKQWCQRLRDLGSFDFHRHQQRYTIALLKRLSLLFQELLAGYVPDVVTSWCPVPFLRDLFPRTTILYKEAGFFGVAPFPWSHYLDPCGFHAHSWLRRHFSEARTCGEEARAALNALREVFAHEIAQRGPFRGLIHQWKARFSKLILVAVQANNYFLFDKSCGYRSQAHLVFDVLANVPRDVGVIVTQHHSHLGVTESEKEFIANRYPNCLFHPEFRSYFAPTQYLLDDCDAVVTTASAVGWLANFFQKPVFVMADCHLTPLSAVNDLSELANLLARTDEYPIDIDDDHLAWILFHYSIPLFAYEAPRHARRLLERFTGLGAVPSRNPFHEPVLPYREYVDGICSRGDWSIPHRKAA